MGTMSRDVVDDRSNRVGDRGSGLGRACRLGWVDSGRAWNGASRVGVGRSRVGRSSGGLGGRIHIVDGL